MDNRGGERGGGKEEEGSDRRMVERLSCTDIRVQIAGESILRRVRTISGSN